MFDKEYVSIDDDNCNDMISEKIKYIETLINYTQWMFIENCVLPSH